MALRALWRTQQGQPSSRGSPRKCDHRPRCVYRHGCVVVGEPLTADTALRIGQALGMTPDYWLNLQRMYDLDVARARTDVSAIEPLVEASA